MCVDPERGHARCAPRLEAEILRLAGIFRAAHVLSHYRGFRLPEGARFAQWVARLLAHPAFAATCSDEQLYLDSYER
jgi:glutathione S-transferase